LGAHVRGHERAVVGGGIVELARGAMAAIVERDHAPAGLGQRRDPAGMHPVDRGGRGEAVHQDDRLALPLVEKGDLDAAVLEALPLTPRRGGTRRPCDSAPSPARPPGSAATPTPKLPPTP